LNINNIDYDPFFNFRHNILDEIVVTIPLAVLCFISLVFLIVCFIVTLKKIKKYSLMFDKVLINEHKKWAILQGFIALLSVAGLCSMSYFAATSSYWHKKPSPHFVNPFVIGKDYYLALRVEDYFISGSWTLISNISVKIFQGDWLLFDCGKTDNSGYYKTTPKLQLESFLRLNIIIGEPYINSTRKSQFFSVAIPYEEYVWRLSLVDNKTTIFLRYYGFKNSLYQNYSKQSITWMDDSYSTFKNNTISVSTLSGTEIIINSMLKYKFWTTIPNGVCLREIILLNSVSVKPVLLYFIEHSTNNLFNSREDYDRQSNLLNESRVLIYLDELTFQVDFENNTYHDSNGINFFRFDFELSCFENDTIIIYPVVAIYDDVIEKLTSPLLRENVCSEDNNLFYFQGEPLVINLEVFE